MKWLIVYILDTAFVFVYWGLRYWMVRGCKNLLPLKNLSTGIRRYFTLFLLFPYVRVLSTNATLVLQFYHLSATLVLH